METETLSIKIKRTWFGNYILQLSKKHNKKLFLFLFGRVVVTRVYVNGKLHKIVKLKDCFWNRE